MSKPKKSEETHGKVMEILNRHLRLTDSHLQKDINEKFLEIFKNHPPNYKEKTTICKLGKEFVLKLGKKVLEMNNLTNQITDAQMYRSITKNLMLFKYVVVILKDSEFSNDIKQIAEKYVSAKTIPKLLPIPKIDQSKPCTTKEEKPQIRIDDAYLGEIFGKTLFGEKNDEGIYLYSEDMDNIFCFSPFGD